MRSRDSDAKSLEGVVILLQINEWVGLAEASALANDVSPAYEARLFMYKNVDYEIDI